MKKIFVIILLFFSITSFLFASWEKREEVDIFGDKTGETFLYAKVEGTSYSSMLNEEPSSLVLIAKPYKNGEKQSIKFIFELHDGLEKNVIENKNKDIIYFKIKDEKENVYSLESNSFEMTGKNAYDLYNILCESSYIKLAILFEDITYNFKVDNPSFFSIVNEIVLTYQRPIVIEMDSGESEEIVIPLTTNSSDDLAKNEDNLFPYYESLPIVHEEKYNEFSFSSTCDFSFALKINGENLFKNYNVFSTETGISTSFENIFSFSNNFGLGFLSEIKATVIFSSSEDEGKIFPTFNNSLLFTINTKNFNYNFALGCAFSFFTDEYGNAEFSSFGPSALIGIEYDFSFFSMDIGLSAMYLPSFDNLVLLSFKCSCGYKF